MKTMKDQSEFSKKNVLNQIPLFIKTAAVSCVAFVILGVFAFNNKPGDHQLGRTVSIVSAHTNSNATNCGGPGDNQITNGWTTTIDFYKPKGTYTSGFYPPSGGQFNTSTGVFTAKVAGIYQVCASIRCETSACDVSLRHNGTQIGAMGTDLIERLTGDAQNFGGHWTSHSICRTIYLYVGSILSLHMESAQSNDCIFDTAYRYGSFEVNLLHAEND